MKNQKNKHRFLDDIRWQQVSNRWLWLRVTQLFFLQWVCRKHLSAEGKVLVLWVNCYWLHWGLPSHQGLPQWKCCSEISAGILQYRGSKGKKKKKRLNSGKVTYFPTGILVMTLMKPSPRAFLLKYYACCLKLMWLWQKWDSVGDTEMWTSAWRSDPYLEVRCNKVG